MKDFKLEGKVKAGVESSQIEINNSLQSINVTNDNKWYTKKIKKSLLKKLNYIQDNVKLTTVIII